MNYDFADRLVELRRAKSMSQEDLAGALGLSRQAISKWERAESAPDIGNLVALSELYGITLDELVHGNPSDDAADSDESADASGAIDVTENADASGAIDATESADASGAIDATEIADASEPADEIEVADANEAANTDETTVETMEAAVLEDAEAPASPSVEESVATSTPTIAESETAPNTAYQEAYGHGANANPSPAAAASPSMPGPATDSASATQSPAGGPYAAESTPAISSAPKHTKAWQIFPYPLLCVVVYLFCGFFLGLWHPAWIIFITIPFYYWVVSLVLHDPNYKAAHDNEGR